MVTKFAGYLKRLKLDRNKLRKGLGKFAQAFGKTTNKFVNITKPFIKAIPIVGNPLYNVTDKLTNTLTKAGETLQNNHYNEFKNYLKDTYKSSPFIAPIRYVDAIKDGKTINQKINNVGNEFVNQITDSFSYFN